MEFSEQQNTCTRQTLSNWAEEEERFVIHCQESRSEFESYSSRL